jgi:hypothetical protein
MPEPLTAGCVLLPQGGVQSRAYIAQGLDGLKSLSLCSWHISDNSKQIKYLNVRPETLKLLQETAGNTYK